MTLRTSRANPLTQSIFTLMIMCSAFFLSPLLAAQQPVAEAAEDSALSTEVIRSVVNSHAGAVSDCYRGALLEEPSIKGTMRVQFTIASDGRVEASQVEPDTLENNTLQSCLIDAIDTWVFPEPRGGRSVRVTYPFYFSTDPNDAQLPPAQSSGAASQEEPDSPVQEE